MRFELLPLFVAASTVTAKVSYDGAKAIRIPVGEDVTPLMDIISKLELPTWKGVQNGVPQANSLVDLVVPAEKVDEFNTLVADINHEVMHEDLGASIAAETATVSAFQAGVVDLSWYNAYHAYADHVQYLKDLQALYPKNSEIVVAGDSGNGNPITGIHFYGNAGKGKPAVVIHGTVHAREWITTLTVEYLAYNLLSNYSTNTEYKSIVDKYDFFIFPVVNPDGFLYTQTNDRLWRKNRQSVSTSTCLGRDINRNWPFQWSFPGGSSTNPCAQDYRGVTAGDSPENKVLVAQINALQKSQGVQLFIDVHSYSQLFMTPYGYSCDALSAKNDVYQSLAKGTSAAITAVYGTKYVYGPICSTIYQATGTSVDYVSDVTQANFSFTIELRDTGANGFVLPPSQILPTSLETFEGFKYLLKNI
ncbi:hypothetical protein B0J14DRAFT_157534 [Halenospora varia]|nr:hypothetical protein B0J14DRAFT_157534 [Halenospora varia]